MGHRYTRISRIFADVRLCKRLLASALFLLASLGSSPARQPQPERISITHFGRALQPGEVVRIAAVSAKPLKKLEARAFQKEFSLYPGRTSLEWQGLIGIDLETKPGSYEVQLHAVQEDGTTQKLSHMLAVKDKVFPTRHLTVDEKFVNPPPEIMDRIREESLRVEGIYKRVTPTRLWQGPFIAPVPGTPNSTFGTRSILNGQPRSPHTGADFEADTGTPVRVPNSGKIVLAAELYYSGNTMIIDHGLGLYSLFAHLSRFGAKEGTEVKRRQIVGYAGSTGRVTGPHLHWSVRLAGARVDPLSLIAAVSRSPGVP